jgi:hypothetical protein
MIDPHPREAAAGPPRALTPADLIRLTPYTIVEVGRCAY